MLSWIRRGPRDVVELEAGDQDLAQRHDRIGTLEGRVATLSAMVRLLVGVVRLSGFRLD